MMMIIFVSQTGKSNLVCSSDLSITDVLMIVNELNNLLIRVNELNLKNTDESTDFE